MLGSKLRHFVGEPLTNKAARLTNIYYRFKAIVVYRFVFKSIGQRVTIRKPILISNPQFITIGNDVFIRDGLRMEIVHNNPRKTPALVIGNNTNIEQNVHIICHHRVTIGANVSVTGHCSIVDVTHPYADITDPVKIGARIQDDDACVEIGDGSFIGFGSVILPNVKIGKYVVIGANSVVACDIPDYSVAAGAPAKVLRRFDHAAGAWIKVESIRGE